MGEFKLTLTAANNPMMLHKPAKIHLRNDLAFWVWTPQLNRNEIPLFNAAAEYFIARSNLPDERLAPAIASAGARQTRIGRSLTEYERMNNLSRGSFREVFCVKIIGRHEPQLQGDQPPEPQVKIDPPPDQELVGKEVHECRRKGVGVEQRCRELLENEYRILMEYPHVSSLSPSLSLCPIRFLVQQATLGRKRGFSVGTC